VVHLPESKRFASLVLASAVAAAAAAQPPEAEEPARTDSPDRDTKQIIESARETVRSTALWLASGVDSWFGDRPFSEGGSVTDGVMSVDLLFRQRRSPDVGVRFNARFRLPNLDRLTYVFVGRDNQDDVVTDKPGALSHEQQLLQATAPNRATFAGVGRALNEAVDFRVGLRGGLKLYAQARFRGWQQVGAADVAEYRETLFWTRSDRFGSTTVGSYTHPFSPTLLGRWIGSATTTQAQPKLAWSSLAGLYRSFGRNRLLSVEALINGQFGSGVGASDYGIQARWEQPVYFDWLIGGVVAGRFWPRTDPTIERRGAWALGVNAKMLF
jgi:hypothetical protein